MPDANGLMFATMEPPAGMEDEFNDWYDLEHLPERNAIPGFLSGTRWVCVHGFPRWLAVYFLTEAAVLHAPAYVKVGGANSSPWTKRVTARTIGRQRVVGERIGKGDNTPFDPQRTARLLVARYPVAAANKETALLRSIEKTTAGMPEKLQARLFRGIEASQGALWLLAAFSQPVGVDGLATHLGTLGGVGATFFNLYMPYVKSVG